MTTTYTIDYTDGRPKVTGLSYAEAKAYLRAQFPQAVIGHDGDLESGGDRTLVWETEKDSEGRGGDGDDGALAVAEIRAVEPEPIDDEVYGDEPRDVAK